MLGSRELLQNPRRAHRSHPPKHPPAHRRGREKRGRGLGSSEARTRMRGRVERIPSECSGSFSLPRSNMQQAARCPSRVQAANDLAACTIGPLELSFRPAPLANLVQPLITPENLSASKLLGFARYSSDCKLVSVATGDSMMRCQNLG